MHPRILVIEDNRDNREILRDLLTSVGYEILEATTGPQGVCAAVTHRPDLILMDLHLPGLDGYDATRRIKAHPALGHIPIIAVTSYALSGDDEEREDGQPHHAPAPWLRPVGEHDAGDGDGAEDERE